MKILIITLILALLFISCAEKPMLGSDCGTVSPDGRDECCARQNQNTIHIQCVGNWKYTEKGCAFVCE